MADFKKFVFISDDSNSIDGKEFTTEAEKFAYVLSNASKADDKWYKSIIFRAATKEIYNRGIVFGASTETDLEDALHYNTTLGDLTTPSDLGGISKGTKASDLNGKTVDEMITMLLFPEINPTITAPSATTKFASGFTANGLYEVGSTLPTQSNLTYSFNRGSIKVAGLSDKYRAGEASNATYSVSGKTSTFDSTLFEEGTYTYTATVSYAAGDTALTSYSNTAKVDANGNTITNPLAAGSVTATSISVKGVYAIYASSTTAGTLTKQTLTSSKSGVKLTLVGGAGQVFAVKGTVSSIMEYNSVSGKYDISKLSGYTSESITKQDANGTDVTYTQYTRNDQSGEDVLVQITFA